MIQQCNDCKQFFDMSQMRGWGLAGEIPLCNTCSKMRDKKSTKFLLVILMSLVVSAIGVRLLQEFARVIK